MLVDRDSLAEKVHHCELVKRGLAERARLFKAIARLGEVGNAVESPFVVGNAEVMRADSAPAFNPQL